MSEQDKDALKSSNDIPPRLALLQMITGFWVSQAIYVSAKLGIADMLKDGPKSCFELAKSTNVSSRELFRLLRFLASLNVFAEDEEGNFKLTPLAANLQSDVPGSLRAMAIMYGEEIYQAWGNVFHSIKTGETAFDHIYQCSHFQYLAQNPEASTVFNQAMTEFTRQESNVVISTYDFSQYKIIVDVGGGYGSFMAAILTANPKLDGILFDLPQVIEGAKAHIESAGVTGRCTIRGGDFFESIPEGGDVYICKNIILNWDDEQCVTILKNCRHSMSENSKLLVIEAVIPPRNIASFSKMLDLHMLVVNGGRGRTEAEFRKLFTAAGFKLSTIISTQSPTSIIEGIPI